MADHINDRKKIIKALREELVGPSPQGQEIDCSQAIIFNSYDEANGPFSQKVSLEEIIIRDTPTLRYGVGVLYSSEIIIKEEEVIEQHIPEIDEDQNFEDQNRIISAETQAELLKKEQIVNRGKEEESEDLDLSSANTYRQSSMGVSFLVKLTDDSTILVNAEGGRYHKKPIKVNTNGKEKEYTWWLRNPVKIHAEFDSIDLCVHGEKLVKATRLHTENVDGLKLDLEIFSRPFGNDTNVRLVTVCLINRTQQNGDQYCLFQTSFKASLRGSSDCYIMPYPENHKPSDDSQDHSQDHSPDEEEKSIALLYRSMKTFAVGHGCAAEWEIINEDKALLVKAEPLPQYETASMTPDIKTKDGKKIEVSMAQLAGLIPGKSGIQSLKDVIEYYWQWITEKRKEAESLQDDYRIAAQKNLSECERCYQRMVDGLNYLQNDNEAWKAFQLANHAMLVQQLHSQIQKRKASYDNQQHRLVFTPSINIPDPCDTSTGRGKWRAFQIAFLLMSIESAVKGELPDRTTVDLIWFPTGGGKTEAYLGLAAFAIFRRRMIDKNDIGVHVIMRYTLRLLSAQQFQRASRLICAMEHIRKNNRALFGELPFSIGIWLGSDSTPNKRKDAIVSLRELQRGDVDEHPFILSQCPWCGASMGRLSRGNSYKKAAANAPKVLGYEQKGMTVIFRCADSQCEFNKQLPIYVIDEDIYEFRPSIIIGTVDKFAMLAWNPNARSIFGINTKGERFCSPPGLIIQDELHLISGPLGSMTGLYETIIEELCIDRRGETVVYPKIVCSTATIRRYKEQIQALYARDRAALFPPPGLTAGDSFFAKNATEEDGNTLLPGRLYVGVHAPGLRSMQTTQVRTFSSLLQAPVALNKKERDPWWTLLVFFNSLRELGTTLTLLQSDIPDRLLVLKNRKGLDFKDLRRLDEIQELTSRLSGDSVTKAIDDLMVTTIDDHEKAVDVCLASNIIEVGVDIDRLSLMCIVGQPKTTAQYIQVSGRVGRKWQERPGIVVTIYGAGKPRDRSHFEKFRSYHEKLYAQVEPTSVTPFSPPVLDRALHAVMVAYVRQFGDEGSAESPYPYPSDLLESVKELLKDRVATVDRAEADNVLKVFERRAKQWKTWQHIRYQGKWDDANIPLLRRAGSYISKERELITWQTPTSMRNVDAECKATITQLYSRAGENNE